MDENAPLLNTNITSTVHDSIALLKLQQYLKEKRCGCCFNTEPLTNARIINVREMSGYVLHLWTLMENRWTTVNSAPYYGDEPLLNNPLGDIWNDYQFTPPAETLLSSKKSREISQDIKDTQEKQRCSTCDCQGEIKCEKCEGYGHLKCAECNQEGQIKCCTEEKCTKCSGKGSYVCGKCAGHGKYDCVECLSQGQIQCPTCKGQRFLVVWSIIHVKWYNIKSTITHKPNVRCILPSSEIEHATDKVTCLVHDNIWSSTINSIDDVLNKCVGLPDDLLAKTNDVYRNEHDAKSGKIIRLYCVAQRLKIKEFEYKLDNINGKEN